MAAVTLKGVSKSYDSVSVLTEVNLNISDGEFAVLVGASGCGKSTLLRMIAGLESISGGDIHIGERRVNDLEPRERDIAMVFQSYALYPHLRVRDNMGFSLKLQGKSQAEIDAQCTQTAQQLNLTQLMERYPRQLSGGQRQRVAMGRAIVRRPKVFLFDEPLSNLDAKLRIAMRTEIRALHQRLSATSIYVTHDQVEAMTMADRMVVMNEGRIEQIGAPVAVYDHPETLYVAQFIGSPSINVIEGRITESGASMRSHQGTSIALGSTALREGLGVHLAFRPEHVQIGDGAGIQGTVDVVENLGYESFLYIDTVDGRLCALAPRNHKVRPNDKVCLSVRREHFRLFDARSGRRLDLPGETQRPQ
jgi:multiple sugar transport system ATP-binding protein